MYLHTFLEEWNHMLCVLCMKVIAVGAEVRALNVQSNSPYLGSLGPGTI